MVESTSAENERDNINDSFNDNGRESLVEVQDNVRSTAGKIVCSCNNEPGTKKITSYNWCKKIQKKHFYLIMLSRG